jgi:hypothetical protein
MSLPKPEGPSGIQGWARVAAVLTGGVVIAGVSDFLLSAAGYPSLGAFVWAVGYGGAVIAVWFLVFRGRSFEPGAVPEDGTGEADGGADANADANAGASAGAPAGTSAVPEGYAPSSGTTGERKG